MKDVRTWVEIDARALRSNAEQFLTLIPPTTRLMAVIKSNAYGHGLIPVAKSLLALRSFSEGGWFGVDSITEARRLRREGIQHPILVLGHTLLSRVAEAGAGKITLTVSNFEAVEMIAKEKNAPPVHIKVDTGMHRQGFLPSEIPRLIKTLKHHRITPTGIYTHFASAKDPADTEYTRRQFLLFQNILTEFRDAGFTSMIRHAASSGAALLFPETHLDMVRIGMGLYGYWPSQESEIMKQELGIILKPVLTWKTIIGEIKTIPAGSSIGYDCTEQVKRRTKIAVLPIGYWHGYDRGLSGAGEVLIRGARAKILGRISMDMIVIDITDIPRVRVGDEVVLLGIQGRATLSAHDLAEKIHTTHYEVLTRINPLIRRIMV